MAGVLSGAALTWRFPTLRARTHPSCGDTRVSVIVPARNEEIRIRPLLGSLERQYPHELIVVDDDSADRTAEIATAAGARVVRSTGPPAG